MPSLSKKQQKFMGIVRSIQKGEQPASKFSKDARDAAKDMKKSSVKKFAKTKHKGLPTKVKKEYILNKLKETIKQEMKDYTYGSGDIVKDVNPTCPHYGAMGKVKSVNPRSVVFVVMNKGKNFKPGMELEKSHDQMKKMNESILNEINSKQFVKYMNDFYGPKGIYPDKKKRTLGQKEINLAYSILLKQKPNFEIGFDSTDREMIRDILIKQRKLDPDYSKKESVNEKMRPAVKKLLKQKGYGPIFQAIDNSKRQFKQMKYSRGEIQDTLIGMFGNEDPKILQKINESINEMSAKSKKIINKLNKKEKEMFMDMVDMMGFDQVMADYKRDKKAFKQALKDMSESVIKEYVKPNVFNNNFDKAMNMVIKQANNLKGPLAKHPIKRNLNKLKAVQKLYKKFIAPALVVKDSNLEYDFDFAEIEKKLKDGKFKSAIEYSIMNKIGGGGFRSNSFYMLDDKTNKLRDRISGELRKIVNILDKAQLESVEEGFGSDDTLNEKDKKKFEKERVENAEVLGYELTGVKDVKENINEDGHTDVASSKRKVMIMVDDSNELLSKLNGMDKEGSLPSWWSDKITLSQKYLAKAKDYLLNPVESVNEARLDPKQLLQQLGGNRFIAMTGAKNLAIDKPKNELHMKIGRNAKGVSHVRIRLTSMDLYDMEFLQVRAGRIKIKSKEKGVYADQLGKMFKKNTGMNVRL